MLMKAKEGQVRIYDPRGAVLTKAGSVAKRVKSLDGLVLGILDNSKWNANKLLRGSAARLKEQHRFKDVKYFVKHNFSKDAAPELLDEIAEQCDLVLTAIGDCGSCCSCCVRDAIVLEGKGVPSAVIVTTEFVRETELLRAALGMTALNPVIIEHPVSSITQTEVDARVAQIIEQAPRIWIDGHA